MKSSPLLPELSESYKRTRGELRDAIRGTKQTHHLKIQSLPCDRFLQLIRSFVLEPQKLFLTPSGQPSTTIYRDRAMVLLACEGLRPGSIANIAREDFQPNGHYLDIKDHRKRRLGRPSSGTPLLKFGASTSVNSASETKISLWPFTAQAIFDYIDNERVITLAKHLGNRSRGFLFLNQSGGPIGHRSTLTALFKRLGARLRQFGMLDVGTDPHFRGLRQYQFYGYVLRHSAASLYVQLNGTTDLALDAMRFRFGWTRSSDMPQYYAARAFSDKSDMELNGLYDSIISEMRAVKGAS